MTDEVKGFDVDKEESLISKYGLRSIVKNINNNAAKLQQNRNQVYQKLSGLKQTQISGSDFFELPPETKGNVDALVDAAQSAESILQHTAKALNQIISSEEEQTRYRVQQALLDKGNKWRSFWLRIGTTIGTIAAGIGMLNLALCLGLSVPRILQPYPVTNAAPAVVVGQESSVCCQSDAKGEDRRKAYGQTTAFSTSSLSCSRLGPSLYSP